MKNIQKKPVIGLMGGIGSGKSTVAGEFSKLDCAVIDADELAHKALSKEKIKNQIRQCFGLKVFDENGNILRKKLAQIAFSSTENTEKLNAIIHPQVLTWTENLIESHQCQSRVKAIVLDIPLLLETGWEKNCDTLVFVKCDRKQRLERAKKRGIEEKQVNLRENLQFSLDYKENIADNVINNNSDFSALVRQVEEIFSKIVKTR